MTSKLLNDVQATELTAEFQKRNAEWNLSSLHEIANWAEANFQLRKTPLTSTVSRILKKGGVKKIAVANLNFPRWSKIL